MTVTHAILKDICTVLSNKEDLNTIDFSFNLISVLKEKCFLASHLLVIIKLNNNNIKEIDRTAFSGLTSLKYLNLSHNFLSQFSFSYLLDSKILHYLSVKYNTLHDMRFQDGEIFIKILDTNDYRHSCIMPSSVKCNSPQLWYNTCNLLPIGNLKFMLYCVSVFIFFFNILTSILHLKGKQKKALVMHIT